MTAIKILDEIPLIEAKIAAIYKRRDEGHFFATDADTLEHLQVKLYWLTKEAIHHE